MWQDIIDGAPTDLLAISCVLLRSDASGTMIMWHAASQRPLTTHK